MKKYVLAIVIFLMCVLIALVIIFDPFQGPSLPYNKELFLKNQRAYETIANTCLSHNIDSLSDDEVYSYSIMGNKMLYCFNDDKTYTLTQEEKKASEIVYSVFRLDKHRLECLFATDDMVAFSVVTGRASFIYSKSDVEPDFINTPNSKSDRIYVEKITDNWYFICKQD